MNLIKTDYIIIGQGLAGTLAAYALINAGKSILVIDAQPEYTSSKVAAGMFNPINPKRMVKNWNAEELIPLAVHTYRQMEELLQTKLIHEMPVHNVFGSVKEMNDFSVQMEKPAFNQFIDENAADFLQLKAPYGAFTVKNAGWLNIPIMLERFAGYLKKSQHYLVEHVDYNEIILSEQSVQYKNYISAGIIFCEGYKYHLNPFFQGLVYEPTKGDVLTIRCKYLPKDLILKKGIYLVYLGNDMYKVGATYDRKNITERPDPEAKEQLITDLQNMLNVPFEVIKHESGIRPTMRGRKPFVLQHGKHMNLFMMNGLGSKGVMFAPYFANILVKTILDYEATLDDNRGFE